jgi:hypothetical protein
MKIYQVCAVALLLAMGSAMAFADSINDPKIIVRGVSGSNSQDRSADSCGKHNCTDVGLNFSFTIPKGGEGNLFFTNTSGKNWTSLTLIETGEPAADISCATSVFLNCTTKTLKNGSVEILLAGVRTRGALNSLAGIPNGGSFAISFICKGGCWINGGSTVTAHAGTVPEPETVALMITGLGAIFSRRKLWRNRFRA